MYHVAVEHARVEFPSTTVLVVHLANLDRKSNNRLEGKLRGRTLQMNLEIINKLWLSHVYA
jgi:hypothetical protein